MSIHPQIIERDGRKEFVVLPDEKSAASRPPSYPLFISAFPSARSLGAGVSAFQPSAFSVSAFTPAFFPIGINLSGNSGLAFETSSVNFLS